MWVLKYMWDYSDMAQIPKEEHYKTEQEAIDAKKKLYPFNTYNAYIFKVE